MSLAKILGIVCLSLFPATFLAQNKIIQEESQVEPVPSSSRELKRKVAILRFSNETQYGKGLFYNRENDPIAKQALDILSAKLAAADKFILLERSDLADILEEAQFGNITPQMVGADYAIIGSVTQYGRKEVGDAGVFRSSKSQIVEAAVSIRLVDTTTGVILYSGEGKGEAKIKTKQVLGIGGKAGYDATLSDKAISMAISALVENVINKCTNKPWRAYFLSYDENAVVISGGAAQGIRAGDLFQIVERGKSVRNPQTGISLELPGKTVGRVEVLSVGGDTPQSEYAFVRVLEGNVDRTNLETYYLQETIPVDSSQEKL